MAEERGMSLRPMSLGPSSTRRKNIHEYDDPKTEFGKLNLIYECVVNPSATIPSLKKIFKESYNNNRKAIKKALNTVIRNAGNYSTIFIEATQNNTNQRMLSFLLESGADINMCTTKTGKCDNDDTDSMNALLWAMTKGNKPLIKFLSENGGRARGLISFATGHMSNAIRANIHKIYETARSTRSARARSTHGGTRKVRSLKV